MDARESTLTAINRALNPAKYAVAADQAGDIQAAARAYRLSVQFLSASQFLKVEEGVSALSEQQIARVQNLIQIYTARAEVLENSGAAAEKTNNPELRPFPPNFNDQALPKGVVPVPPPANIHRQPYWLLRIFLKTLNTGGFISPDLFAPVAIWQQDDVKIPQLGSKFSACDAMLLHLKILQSIEFRVEDKLEAVERELGEFSAVLDMIQLEFVKKLNYVPKVEHLSGKSGMLSGMKNKMSRLLIKDKEAENLTLPPYTKALISVIELSLPLEEWFLHFEKQAVSNDSPLVQSCLASLRRASEFYQTVLCAILIRDSEILLDRYLSKLVEKTFVVFA